MGEVISLFKDHPVALPEDKLELLEFMVGWAQQANREMTPSLARVGLKLFGQVMYEAETQELRDRAQERYLECERFLGDEYV